MIGMLGLSGFNQSDLMVIIAMITLACVVAGWISDAIMGDAGYGVVGNGILTVLGTVTGLAAWQHFVGSVTSATLPYVTTAAGFSVVAFLLLFALFKRAVE